MIEAQHIENKDITPADLTPNQDMLNLAGSKVSFRDIYEREINLPVVRNKYYMTSDVDDLFILINGMLTNISEQAYRNNNVLMDARKQNEELMRQLTKLKAENESLQKAMQSDNGQYEDYRHTIQVAAQKLAEQNQIIARQQAKINELTGLKNS